MTLPDIALIVPLANFFRVSTDNLFDLEREKEEREIAEYKERSHQFRNKGLIREDVLLWREVTAKYPRNFCCLYQLAHALYAKLLRGGNNDEEQIKSEIISICERILRDCTDDEIRSNARLSLVLTYSFNDDEEKAVSEAMKAQNLWCSREILLARAYKDPLKLHESKQKNTMNLFNIISENIKLSYYDTADDMIFALESLLQMWSLLIYDCNYLFYHGRIADIYTQFANQYASKSDRENSLKNLKLAKLHAEIYDRLPSGTQKYASIFINTCTFDKNNIRKNYDSSDTQLLLGKLSDKRFDFLRGDAEFEKLLAE